MRHELLVQFFILFLSISYFEFLHNLYKTLLGDRLHQNLLKTYPSHLKPF